MNNFTLHLPTKVLFGKGQIAEIKNQIPTGAKILMTYGGGSIKRNGVYDQVLDALKGFEIINKINTAAVNVGRLEQWGITEVSLETLIDAKRIHPSSQALRIIGNGELSKSITVKANYVTP